jgi:glycerophosphoryl diester phosphodiesterase
VLVALNMRGLAWGWPDPFLGRMASANADVMLIGSVSGLGSNGFTRLDTLDELAEVPDGFGGMIWTDRVEVIGPAISKRWPRLSGDPNSPSYPP